MKYPKKAILLTTRKKSKNIKFNIKSIKGNRNKRLPFKIPKLNKYINIRKKDCELCTKNVLNLYANLQKINIVLTIILIWCKIKIRNIIGGLYEKENSYITCLFDVDNLCCCFMWKKWRNNKY